MNKEIKNTQLKKSSTKSLSEKEKKEEEKANELEDITKKTVEDVKGFLKQTSSALTLGIAVIGANAISQFVNTFVDGIVTPAISLILPQNKYEEFIIEIGKSKFLIGEFIAAFINMFIISLIIYFIAKYLIKDEKMLEKAKLK